MPFPRRRRPVRGDRRARLRPRVPGRLPGRRQRHRHSRAAAARELPRPHHLHHRVQRARRGRVPRARVPLPDQAVHARRHRRRPGRGHRAPRRGRDHAAHPRRVGRDQRAAVAGALHHRRRALSEPQHRERAAALAPVVRPARRHGGAVPTAVRVQPRHHGEPRPRGRPHRRRLLPHGRRLEAARAPLSRAEARSRYFDYLFTHVRR